MPKGASPPFPQTGFSPFREREIQRDLSGGQHRGFHPPIRQSHSSLGQNPKSHLHIPFTARGSAYSISRIVSRNLQLEILSIVSPYEGEKMDTLVWGLWNGFLPSHKWRKAPSLAPTGAEKTEVFKLVFRILGVCLEFGIWNLEFRLLYISPLPNLTAWFKVNLLANLIKLFYG